MSYVSTEAIVLRTVRHSDKHTIVRLYTPTLGTISCVTPAGETREARRRRAMLMPLGRINCVVAITPGHDLHRLRDVQPANNSLADILSHPVRIAQAQFLADLLDSVLREPQPDATLYGFITHTVGELSHVGNGIANFHLLTMLRLTHFLGIEPDWGTYTHGSWLDLADGVFRSTPPLHDHALPPDHARWINTLHLIPTHHLGLLRLTGAMRNYIVDSILAYYRLHDINTGRLISLDILRQLF